MKKYFDFGSNQKHKEKVLFSEAIAIISSNISVEIDNIFVDNIYALVILGIPNYVICNARNVENV